MHACFLRIYLDESILRGDRDRAVCISRSSQLQPQVTKRTLVVAGSHTLSGYSKSASPPEYVYAHTQTQQPPDKLIPIWA